MPYRDEWVTCEQCGNDFIFRVEDQRRQEDQGEPISPPDLCSDCRRTTESRVPRRSRARPRPERTAEPPPVLGYGPHEGTVKWYSGEKGYGFILHPSGAEVFFHHTGIAPGETHRFPDGTPVTFLVEETEKGPQAVEVQRMDAGDD